MAGPGTGETFSFAEGKLYLYASASGTTSGSGIGFARDATLTTTYGWLESFGVGGVPVRVLTGARADMTIANLYTDRAFVALANGTAAVNAKFEGLVTAAGLGKSAQWVLYSGVVESMAIQQQNGDLFRATYTMHANSFSAFGQ